MHHDSNLRISFRQTPALNFKLFLIFNFLNCQYNEHILFIKKQINRDFSFVKSIYSESFQKG